MIKKTVYSIKITQVILLLGLIGASSCFSRENNYKNKPSGKKAIFVVGTGRSGTSCLMGILEILGASIGSNFVNPYPLNAKGEFELLDLRKINMEICAYLAPHAKKGVPKMFYQKPVNWEQEPKREGFKNRIKSTIESVFNNNETIIAIKDPRMSFLLPLYISAVQELGYEPKIIIMIREPHDIVSSFKLMIRNAEEKQIYTYMANCLMTLLKDTCNHRTLVLDFHQLINNTKEAIKQLHKFVPGLKSYEQATEELKEFVDVDLQQL